MSRSGYSDEWDNSMWLWRGAVASAIRGKRGQEFFRRLINALDTLPGKRLIQDELQTQDGECCALGSVAVHEGVDIVNAYYDDREAIAKMFDIAPALAAEVMYENDEQGCYDETPEQRWQRIRAWAVSNLRERTSG